MEDLLKQILTEGGLIYLLFFMIVGGFIWKGIPYIVQKFESMINNFTVSTRQQQENFNISTKEQQENFTKILKEQQEIFRISLNKISDDFVIQIEKSNSFHELHSRELKEIKEILDKKLK